MDLFIIGAVVIVLVVLVGVVALRSYRKVGPNEALIISGGKRRTVTVPDGSERTVGYRIRIGGGTLVMPMLEQAETLPLEIIPMDFVVEDAISTNGIRATVRGTAEVKIAGDEPSIVLAAEQFLGKPLTDIRDVALRTLEGSTRALIGTMPLEALNKNRKGFTGEVFGDVSEYFANMGLKLLSYNLKEITDPSGYLEALGKPRIVEARRDAEVAEAEAARDAIIRSAEAQKEGDVAKLAAETEVAEASHVHSKRQSELSAELNRSKAAADFAYELERHKLSQSLKAEEAKVRMVEKDASIELEKREIERVNHELEATVRQPAAAEKYRLAAEAEGMAEAKRIQGEVEAGLVAKLGTAEAEAIRLKAEAWSSCSEPALLQQVFEKLPELAREVAAPISKVDKIVMVSNDGTLGTSKITGEMAAMMSQLPEVVRSVSGFDMEGWLRRVGGGAGSSEQSQKPDAGGDEA